jgi:hypothetical protein
MGVAAGVLADLREGAADAIAADEARVGLNGCQWRAEPLDDDGGADLVQPSGELDREWAQHFRATRH